MFIPGFTAARVIKIPLYLIIVPKFLVTGQKRTWIDCCVQSGPGHGVRSALPPDQCMVLREVQIERLTCAVVSIFRIPAELIIYRRARIPHVTVWTLWNDRKEKKTHQCDPASFSTAFLSVVTAPVCLKSRADKDPSVSCRVQVTLQSPIVRSKERPQVYNPAI